MISEEEARARILQNVQPLPPRNVALADAVDCFAAKDYSAVISLPVFDNSAMDGYAVVASSCGPGKRLRVVGEQPAGVDRHLRLALGDAIRIFTGAPLPAGADAVIMQEDVTRDGDEIVSNVDVDPGAYIRRRGCDLSEGQRIIAAGERIRSVTTPLLASQGFAEVMVGGQASAGIISTGDELAKPGERLQAGQIYESNSVLLEALLQRCGVIERSIEQCPDDSDALMAAFRRGMRHHVLLINGGVSVGEHDLVKAAIQSLGGEIDLWRVAIKPGKPFLYGRIGKCIMFGLPGNPVSAFVTFLQFVRPAILKMMGGSDDELQPQTVPARLMVDLRNDGDRAHYVRGKLRNGCFTPVGRQESHALFGLSQSNALLRLAPGAEIKHDTAVNVEIWD